MLCVRMVLRKLDEGSAFMRKWLRVLSVFFLCAANIRAAADLKSGLVGDWRFSQSDGVIVNDLSGHGLDGRISSVGTLEGTPRALDCNRLTDSGGSRRVGFGVN